jgi:hypothetical protein
MLDKEEDQLVGEISSNHLDNTTIRCVECLECHTLFCDNYYVPWNSSIDREEFHILLGDERNYENV